MATIGDIVKQALQKILCEEDTNQFSATQVTHGITAANLMLESWSLERLKQYKMTLASFNTANATTSYVIGTGQTWNTAQPIEIENAYIRVSSDDFFVEPVRRREYLQIRDKAKAGRPEKLFFERGETNGTVYLWPVPVATETIWLDMRRVIASYSLSTDVVTLPRGYERALVWNLAIELCADYEVNPSELLKARAAESLAALMQLNSPEELTGLQPSAPQDRGRVMDVERG